MQTEALYNSRKLSNDDRINAVKESDSNYLIKISKYVWMLLHEPDLYKYCDNK